MIKMYKFYLDKIFIWYGSWIRIR